MSPIMPFMRGQRGFQCRLWRGCIGIRHFFFELVTLSFPILLPYTFTPCHICLFQGDVVAKKQLSLNLNKGRWGGRRSGTGRKRIHSKGVAHRARETVKTRTPLHINFKYRTQIRNKTCLQILKRAIINSRKMGLRIIHFSLQHNHIHLIVEAENNEILTAGMRSLTITFAKGLNKGKVQLERYHLHVLKTLRETKNAIQYVLFNQQKHEKGSYSKVDGFSSLSQLRNALELIRNFAKDNRMFLEVVRSDHFELDKGASYLLKNSSS